MKIYCCDCRKEVEATLTDGREIYPHREDLYHLPFWKCNRCDNYVGCHHKTKDRTKPLGCIPNEEIKDARKHIHLVLEPLWKKNLIDRKKLYQMISKELGYKYHTANIKSIEDARVVYKTIMKISKRI